MRPDQFTRAEELQLEATQAYTEQHEEEAHLAVTQEALEAESEDRDQALSELGDRPRFVYESLMELRRVTEWRDGCVFRTELVGEVWVGFGLDSKEQPPAGHMFVSLNRPVQPRRRAQPVANWHGGDHDDPCPAG